MIVIEDYKKNKLVKLYKSIVHINLKAFCHVCHTILTILADLLGSNNVLIKYWKVLVLVLVLGDTSTWTCTQKCKYLYLETSTCTWPAKYLDFHCTRQSKYSAVLVTPKKYLTTTLVSDISDTFLSP